MPDEAFRRKTRTRQHVIADLGVNYVERQILLAGYTVERSRHDYGLDLSMKTFTDAGEVEMGRVELQVKATDHFTPHEDGKTFPLRVGLNDFKTWLLELTPVALVLYDASHDRAFWLDVQEYAHQEATEEDSGGATITLRIPIANVFDATAAKLFRERKECIAQQIPRPNWRS